MREKQARLQLSIECLIAELEAIHKEMDLEEPDDNYIIDELEAQSGTILTMLGEYQS